MLTAQSCTSYQAKWVRYAHFCLPAHFYSCVLALARVCVCVSVLLSAVVLLITLDFVPPVLGLFLLQWSGQCLKLNSGHKATPVSFLK